MLMFNMREINRIDLSFDFMFNFNHFTFTGT